MGASMFTDPPRSKRFKNKTNGRNRFLDKLISTASYLTVEPVRAQFRQKITEIMREKPKIVVTSASRAPCSSLPSSTTKPPSELFALEQRIVFDGAAVVTADHVSEQVAERQAADAGADSANGADHGGHVTPFDLDDLAHNISPDGGITEIAFVDASLGNVGDILDAIDPSVEIIMLDSTRDGVE